jgi:hypothetical protein
MKITTKDLSPGDVLSYSVFNVAGRFGSYSHLIVKIDKFDTYSSISYLTVEMTGQVTYQEECFFVNESSWGPDVYVKWKGDDGKV